ncbi:MAG: NAD(P)H-hydrate dehydratase [Bacteroidales bacterium]|nr:NAD(P)H-hydrate dehydratase [Bacteroidales bacterium]
MKILPVEAIREADDFTIKNEPIAHLDLMERAAGACFHWLEEHLSKKKKVHLFCGTGNNGGDGFAIARMLSHSGFMINTYLVGSSKKMSPSGMINYQQIEKECSQLSEFSSLPDIHEDEVIIDALFGSGLTRPIEGFTTKIIRHINESKALVVSIDVPSGLFCDTSSITTSNDPVIIHADYTLTFSPPKLAFFFPENDRFVGSWHLLDIGIMEEYISNISVKNFMIGKEVCQPILKKRNKFAHKGNFGHALLICGSTGKMGASVLCAKACLRCGAGLVTVHVPKSGIDILQISVPEAMLSIDPDMDRFTVLEDLSGYSVIAIGPGLGRSEQSAKAIKLLIQNFTKPLVLDADAINILSENKTWLGFLQTGCVFTPHPKEFERLVGKSHNDFERNQKQREFSSKYNCYIVLKGAHTAITTPDGRCFFNTTGNPGMATGGSGDVLTGMIAGLLAQGYSSLESCLLGVYIHGLSGDLAFQEQGNEALIASDIINHLGKSFQTLYGKF